MQEAIRKAKVLLEALPYMQSFHHKVLLVKLGGSAMTDEDHFVSTLTDIVFMAQCGTWPVLVHGGGPLISEEIKRRGKEPTFVGGRRVTDEETLAIVEEVLIDRVNAKIVSAIAGKGGRARGLHNRDHHYLHAEKLLLEDEAGQPADLGLVGHIVDVDLDLILDTCRAGYIPVIAPLATGPNGETLNVNADDVATRVAAHLEAEKLVLLSDVPGILTDVNDEGSLLSTLSADGAEEMVQRRTIDGGMIPKVQACLEALAAGVHKAHIIDGRLEHSLLLEIFTDRGVGTQIVH